MKGVRLVDPVKPAPPWHRAWVLGERAAWAVGLGCLVTWSAWHIERTVRVRRDLQRFAATQAVVRPQTSTTLQAGSPDLSLWDAKRVTAWQHALQQPAATPLAVLRIPKIRLEVPVLPGSDDVTLDRAVGHIEDTALPGTDGNSGVAGHRDGFFRGLKDIVQGDTLEIETLSGKEVYRVERTWIVDPEDISVLDTTPERSVTLVTCYPFYYVGPAPLRYIVRAARFADAAHGVRSNP